MFEEKNMKWFYLTEKEAEMDVNILDKLTTTKEMSGLLNWALEGLDSLEKNNGYIEIMDMEESKEFMEKGTNPIRDFVDTYISASSGREWITDLYKWYVVFCKDKDYPLVNDAWFSRKAFPLCPMGTIKGHTRKRKYWDGITCNFLSEGGKKQEKLDGWTVKNDKK